MKQTIYVYANYEYEDHPLFILRLPCSMPIADAANLLSQINEWYGNTDQDTTEYALEFEVWARNLLLDGDILLNPRHLAIGDVQEEFEEFLAGGHMDNLRAYQSVMAMGEQALLDAWNAEGRPDQFEVEPDVRPEDEPRGEMTIRLEVEDDAATQVLYCQFSEQLSKDDLAAFGRMIREPARKMNAQGYDNGDIDWELLVSEACAAFVDKLNGQGRDITGTLIDAPYDYILVV